MTSVGVAQGSTYSFCYFLIFFYTEEGKHDLYVPIARLSFGYLKSVCILILFTTTTDDKEREIRRLFANISFLFVFWKENLVKTTAFC